VTDIYVDVELTSLNVHGELLSVGFVEAESGCELYIELSDVNTLYADEWVAENVLPLFGRHSPYVLPRAAAPACIDRWLESWPGPVTLLSDAPIDAFEVASLMPAGWARARNVTFSVIYYAQVADELEKYHSVYGERHHALADARALRWAVRSLEGYVHET
jgi:hypothetical protein